MNLNKDSTYSDLSAVVDQNQGVCVFTMGVLRDIHKAGKLGSTVVQNISKSLNDLGLGHSPEELFKDQWKSVIVYRKGSPLGQVVEAVTSITEDSETVLRGLAGKDNPDTVTIRQIRELVCG